MNNRIVAFQIDDELYTQTKKLAVKEEVELSKIYRKALREYVERHIGRPNPKNNNDVK
jgi:hypothetical protein